MTGKSILIVYPHNFTDVGLGVNHRFSGIIHYLNSRGFAVDLLALKNFKCSWPKAIIKKGLPGIRNLYLYDHSAGLKAAWLRNIIHFDFPANLNLLERRITTLPDYAFPGLKRLFKRLIVGYAYEMVIISYVQWAQLLESTDRRRFRSLIMIEDCLSDNLAQNETRPEGYRRLFDEEIRRIGLFDDALCISREEMEKLAYRTPRTRFHYVPVFRERVIPPAGQSPEFDLLFTGSDHPSNRRGIDWFLEKVLPLIKKPVKMLCVGQIVRHIGDHDGIVKVEFMEHISEAYFTSRLTVNPVQDGTGMKVKLIESLAYGIPVVTTSAGLSGIRPGLKDFFIIADQPAAFARSIDRLISDKDLYLEYSRNLDRIFRENFSTEVASRTLDEIFTGR